MEVSAISCRIPQCAYTGVRARGRGPEAVVGEQSNELVELAKVPPGAEARIVTEVRIQTRATPGRCVQKRACYS